MSAGWLSPWAIFDPDLKKWLWKNADGNTPQWEFRNMSGITALVKGGLVTTTGTVGALETEYINATAGDIVRTLPDATLSENLEFNFKRIDDPTVTGKTVTIAAAGTDTIEGLASIPLSGLNELARLRAFGGVWYMFK